MLNPTDIALYSTDEADIAATGTPVPITVTATLEDTSTGVTYATSAGETFTVQILAASSSCESTVLSFDTAVTNLQATVGQGE